jgi:hypothetical protein
MACSSDITRAPYPSFSLVCQSEILNNPTGATGRKKIPPRIDWLQQNACGLFAAEVMSMGLQGLLRKIWPV